MGGAEVLHYCIVASLDQTDYTKQLEYDYPWVEDTVEPFTSNYDMLGNVCVFVCVCPCMHMCG